MKSATALLSSGSTGYRTARDKVKSIAELAEIAEQVRKSGRTIALCHGVFDLIHFGHLRHIELAREEADVLLVTVTADQFVNKGPGRPIFPEKMRAEMLGAIEVVDYVGINYAPSAESAISAIRPNVYVKGSDYENADDDLTGKIGLERETVERHGGHSLPLESEIGSGTQEIIPEVTILVPTLNEETTVETFLDWCQEGIKRSGIAAEIILVDSSNDGTPDKAVAKGARVVKAVGRGLGRAYQEGIPFVRGKYVIMGDADCTYDFRELEPFIQKLRDGYEFVMGSRLSGYIEPGSMPALHRYFGTPVTTWILNVLYDTHFSDIHCGMRAITRDALVRMDLRSESWQYASEMVLKAVHMKLRTAEVPVRFFKDPEGRLSHHKRSGWLSPWKAGWSNLEVMLTHGAEFFTIRPGLILTALGLLLTLPLACGPIRVGHFVFSLYWMLVGLTLTVVGMQSVYLGCVTRILHDYGGESTGRLLRLFSYNRSVLISGGAFVFGALLMIPLLKEYLRLGFTLSGKIGRSYYMAILGLLFVIVAFTNFVFTLVLHSAALRLHRREVSTNL